MYEKPVLSWVQVQAATAAILDEAAKRPEHPVAVAIVDESGDLISYARMDNCRKFPQRIVINKAYTAAIAGADTQAYIERLDGQGRRVSDYGDPNLAAAPGGIVIRWPRDGAILGGIGVSGLPSGAEDEVLCRIGLKAMDL